MTMKRWEQLYVELQLKSEKLGYDPPTQIGSGNSQVFEFRVGKAPVLLITFRDLGLKPDYAVPNRLWAEGLELVIKRYQELAGRIPAASLPAAIAIVIDNIGDAYIVIDVSDLLALYVERKRRGRPTEARFLTFNVERRGSKYFLLMPEGQPDLELVHVNSMTPVVDLLKKVRTRTSRAAT
jgi:hypothetical protein